MTIYYVIAGNHHEFDEWVANKLFDGNDYTYVTNVHSLYGSINPKGLFMGTWRDRHDIIEIVETLITRFLTAGIPKQIALIHQDLLEEKRTRPYLKELL